jgi:hypothetical protein
MVELTIDTSDLINKTTFEREEFIDLLEEWVLHLENFLNGVQPADALLIGTDELEETAAFQVDSQSKVTIPPRQTTVQRQAITDVPIAGIVYDTDVDSVLFQDGLGWHSLGSAGFGRASVQAYRNTTGGVSIPSGTSGGILLWGDARFDTDNMHTDDGVGSIADTRITFNTAGKYIVTLQISMVAAAAGSIMAQIRLNGNNSNIIASQRILQQSSTHPSRISIQTVYEFAQGDYIEAWIVQNSGAARDVDRVESHFSACLQPSASAVAFSDTFGTPTAGPLSSPYSGSGGGALILTQTDGQFSIT